MRQLQDAGCPQTDGDGIFLLHRLQKAKPHRNAVNKKVMAEMTKQGMPQAMPFDVKRMTYSGFKTIVQG